MDSGRENLLPGPGIADQSWPGADAAGHAAGDCNLLYGTAAEKIGPPAKSTAPGFEPGVRAGLLCRRAIPLFQCGQLCDGCPAGEQKAGKRQVSVLRYR